MTGGKRADHRLPKQGLLHPSLLLTIPTHIKVKWNTADLSQTRLIEFDSAGPRCVGRVSWQLCLLLLLPGCTASKTPTSSDEADREQQMHDEMRTQ